MPASCTPPDSATGPCLRLDKRKEGKEKKKARKIQNSQDCAMWPGKHPQQRRCSTISYILSSPVTSALARSRNSKHDAPRPQRRLHSSAKARASLGFGKGQEGLGSGNGCDAAQPPKPSGHWWPVQTAWLLSPSPRRSSAPTRLGKPAHVSASRKDGLFRRQPNFKGPAWRACRRMDEGCSFRAPGRIPSYYVWHHSGPPHGPEAAT